MFSCNAKKVPCCSWTLVQAAWIEIFNIYSWQKIFYVYNRVSMLILLNDLSFFDKLNIYFEGGHVYVF